jgi:xylulokinase
MWVEALGESLPLSSFIYHHLSYSSHLSLPDIILEKLHDSHDLSRIKAIGGSAQSALVFWSTSFPDLRTASPRLRFTDHLRQLNSLALPNTSTSLDNSATTHALAIETALGGPDRMAQRVGTAAHPALPAARLLQIRETRPEVWASTRRVQTAPAFLASLLLGSSAALSESDACATGMWTHAPTPPGANPPLPGSGQGSRWDDAVLDVVGGSRAEGSRIREWLGSVETSGGAGGGKRLGTVSTFVAERYGFDPG